MTSEPRLRSRERSLRQRPRRLRSASATGYTFVADEELPRLPPFKPVVEQKQPCAAYLKTTDGRRLRIGGSGATPEVAWFIQVLQEGRTYSFPETFQEYRKGQAAKP
jgi:hypothetical protein